MRQGAATASFTPKIDAVAGRVDITVARIGDQVGASGAGLIASLFDDRDRAGQLADPGERRRDGAGGRADPGPVQPGDRDGEVIEMRRCGRRSTVGKRAGLHLRRDPRRLDPADHPRLGDHAAGEGDDAAAAGGGVAAVAARDADRDRQVQGCRRRRPDRRDGLKTGAEGYPADLETLVEGVSVVNDQSGRKLKFLRRIPIDPMTNSTEWGMRSYQDKPDCDVLGRAERVRRVYEGAGHRPRRNKVQGLVMNMLPHFIRDSGLAIGAGTRAASRWWNCWSSSR